MAALDFPNSPVVDQVYTANGTSFRWDGTVWRPIGSTFINDGSFVYYDGPFNVGIGTQTPSAKLEVAGTLLVGSVATFSDDLIVDTDTFFVNVTNDRIGVGTNTPEVDFDIRGTNAQLSNTGSPTFAIETRSNSSHQANFVMTGARTTTSNVIADLRFTNNLSGGEVNSVVIEVDGDGDFNFVTGAPTVSGNEMWHAGNDGPSSGLNADLLDGVQGSAYLRSDVADTMAQSALATATLTVENTNGSGAIIAEFVGSSSSAVIQDIGGGDYGIYNSNQPNGIEFYNGTAGVRLVYNSTTYVQASSSGLALPENTTIGSGNTANVTLDVRGNDAVQLTSGTTAQRPTGVAGMIRWNTTLSTFEGFDGAVWGAIGGSVSSTDDVPEGSNLYFTNERVDDRVNNLLVAGTNITLTYNDGANTLTIDAAAGGGFDLSGNDLTDVGDVSAAGLGDAHFLIYDNGTSTWRAYDITGDVAISDTGVATIQPVAGDLVPDTDNTGNVGTSALTWADGEFTNFRVNGVLEVRNRIDLADNDRVDFGSSDDVKMFYDGTNNTMEMELESAVNSFIITDNGTTRFTFNKANGRFESTTVELDNNYRMVTTDTSLSTVTTTNISTITGASWQTAKVLVQANDTVTGEVQISELLIAHDGTTAVATEYGVVHTGSDPLATFDVDLNAGDIRIRATGASANNTNYKVLRIQGAA